MISLVGKAELKSRTVLIMALLSGLLITNGVQSKTDDQGHHRSTHNQQLVKAWTDTPILIPDKKRTRGFKRLTLKGMHADQATVYPADVQESWSDAVPDNVIEVKNRGGKKGGYHWIGAVSEQENQIRSVATVIYFPNPGPAPRPMLSLQKSALEISPVKLPREHQHFRAGESWDFNVRLNGKPLQNSQIIFETENKTRQLLKTNEDGLVSIAFPYDFPDKTEKVNQDGHGGHERRKKAGFVVTVEHGAEGKQFISHFNYHYTTGAFYNKNLALGVGFALFGMITAAPLLRKSRKGGKA